jgi:hypothetical protein
VSRGGPEMDKERLNHLAEMLWFADQAYEGESEKVLHARLVKRGMCITLRIQLSSQNHVTAHQAAMVPSQIGKYKCCC